MDWEWARIGQFVGALWDAVTTGIPNLWRGWWGQIRDWWNTTIKAWADGLLEAGIQELQAAGMSERGANELRRSFNQAPFVADVVNAAFLFLLVYGGKLKSFTSVFLVVAQRGVNKAWRSQIPPPPDLLRFIELYPRGSSPGGVPTSRAAELLDQSGFTDADQALLLDARRTTPDYTAILTLRNRDVIDDRQALEYLEQLGYRGNDPARVLQLRHWYPSPQDLVTLAGREAFEPDAIQRFKLDQDYPRILDELGEKAGLSREWMRRFWIAHWTTPSLNQAFEMARREVTKDDGTTFDETDLDVYYRLADISPFFGDLLRQIARIPIGRIDIRRMVRAGVLDRAETERRYRHLGYSPSDAVLMADFAFSEAERQGKNLTRTQLEQSYELGLLDAVELENELQALGYDRRETRQLRDLLDTKLRLKRTEERRERIRWEFERYLINREQAMAHLARLNIKALRIEGLLNEWEASREINRALPTVSQVVEWFGNGLIDRAAAVNYLLRRRVSPGDIDLYLAE